MGECAHCVTVENIQYCKAKDKQIVGKECSKCPIYLNKQQDMNNLINTFFGGLK